MNGCGNQRPVLTDEQKRQAHNINQRARTTADRRQLMRALPAEDAYALALFWDGPEVAEEYK